MNSRHYSKLLDKNKSSADVAVSSDLDEPHCRAYSEHEELARDFLGVRIDRVNPDQAFSQLLSWRETRRRGYVTFVNPYTVVSCVRDARMSDAVLNSALAMPDGIGITIASRMLGYGQTRRITGPSFMAHVCDLGRQHGLRHFFYGGREGVAKTAARRLAQRFPGMQVAGTCSMISESTTLKKPGRRSPPFRDMTPDENAASVKLINAASPDVVWVGLGTGKQEKWMAKHIGEINASALLGVGAAFDFHAGEVRRAPAPIQRLGLEWAYRLAREPRRLWRRNLDSFVFLLKVVGQSRRTDPREAAGEAD